MLQDSLKGIIIGGLIGGLITGPGTHLFSRNKNYKTELHFHPQDFKEDTEIAEAYTRLQKYRIFNEEAFDESGRQIDAIFGLELQIESGEIQPDYHQHYTAQRRATQALSYLREWEHDTLIKLKARLNPYKSTNFTMSGNINPDQIRDQIENIKELTNDIEERVLLHVANVKSYYENSDKTAAFYNPPAQFQYIPSIQNSYEAYPLGY